MEIILFNTKDDDRVINKDFEYGYTIEIDFKDSTNLTNPVISLFEEEEIDLQSVNYAIIPEFDRSYFIRSVNATSGGIYYLLLECDVLNTYKSEILSSKAEISRKIEEGDYGQATPRTQVVKEVDIIESDFNVSYKPSIIMTTIGGE